MHTVPNVKMNFFDFIKYDVFKIKRPQKFEIGQVWISNDVDPYKRYTVTIRDIKEDYIQLTYDGQTDTRYSYSMDFIRHYFRLVSK